MKELCSQLSQEHEALDEMVKGLSDTQWDQMTPFDEWTIREEVCHIAYFDDKAHLAATDPEGFQKDMEALFSGVASMEDFFEQTMKELLKLSPAELMAFWIEQRGKMLQIFETLDSEEKIPWYGPPMTAASFVIARMMETWAHGQDVADALNVSRTPTDRLKHIAHLGVKTFGWSFINRGREKPSEKVRVELTSPGGETWLWNEECLENTVSGSAEDFCLVVAQRRHVDDTGLVTKGDIAREWMLQAQVFAGPAAMGPEAGTFK